MEYVEELDSVPEPEHVEMVMDGLIDTVTGTEGFTNAQYYLEAVLLSNGIISHRQVGGTEGILSKIADGAKAAIEYIKKMFQSIWGFFFKSEKKKLEDKVDKALDEAYKSLDDLEKTNVTAANVDEVLNKASKAAGKIKDEPTKRKVQEEIKDAKGAGTAEAKAKAASGIPEKVFKGYFINPSINGINVAAIKNRLGKLTEIKAESDVDLADDIQKIINGLNGYPESVADIDDYASAKKCLDKSKVCLTAITNSLKTIENEKNSYDSLIKEVETKLQTEKGGNKTYRTELEKLKKGLSTITKIITETTAILELITYRIRSISSACGE